MKKRRIVLASLLKPVNDTRMYEKMGASLARSANHEVYLIGYPSSLPINDLNIHFYSLPRFKRISLGRWWSRLKVLLFTIKVKPELFIVTTHELLIVAIVIRILFGTKIIYDIQENYWKNIIYTHAFPKPLRIVVASLVRLKEWITSPFYAQFLLAEKCYSEELGFLRNKYLIVENKCLIPPGFHRKPAEDFIQLIFTGTLAESTGVLQAIDLAKKLFALEPKIRLTIVGHCLQLDVLQKIEQAVLQNPFISLVGGNKLVPHPVIMNAISTSNFGIIYYPPSPHTQNKNPTKLFEYLACQLPILLQNKKKWVAMCAPCHAAVPIDFDQIDIESILQQITSKDFYSKEPVDVSWQIEQEKLINLINHIF